MGAIWCEQLVKEQSKFGRLSSQSCRQCSGDAA